MSPAGIRAALRASKLYMHDLSNLVRLLNLYNNFPDRPGAFQSLISLLCVLQNQHHLAQSDIAERRLTSKLNVESITTFLADA
jgi:hypothetical protein